VYRLDEDARGIRVAKKCDKCKPKQPCKYHIGLAVDTYTTLIQAHRGKPKIDGSTVYQGEQPTDKERLTDWTSYVTSETD